MDRAVKDELAALLCELDAAVIVATHDPEFVAAFARAGRAAGRRGRDRRRVRRPRCSRGGTYFATETARILGGAGGALRPERGRSRSCPRSRDRASEPAAYELAAWRVRVLALALVAGFAWYERTRPDARIVALVGTLAAFAALGRIAFAALPERQADD